MKDDIKRLFRWRLLDEKEGRNASGISGLDLSRSRRELLRMVTGSEEGVSSGESRFPLIVAGWNEIAGPLARNCLPVEIRGRELLVRVEKSVYSQEIALYSREILKKLKKVTSVSLDRIRVEVGRFGSAKDSHLFHSKSVPVENRKRVERPEEVDATTGLLLDGLRKIKENH